MIVGVEKKMKSQTIIFSTNIFEKNNEPIKTEEKNSTDKSVQIKGGTEEIVQNKDVFKEQETNGKTIVSSFKILMKKFN